MPLDRFNLSINVRDFIETVGDVELGGEIFTKISQLLPTHTLEVEYSSFSNDKFHIKKRKLVHISLFDLMNRRDELIDSAHRDAKINLNIWDVAQSVAKHVLTEEYRAYRKDIECLKN